MVASLVVIGFSPDRSELITALTVAAAATAVATVPFARRRTAILAGIVVAALRYRRTFEAETVAALHSSGLSGSFDPVGWTLTLVTLATTAIVVAWSVATLTTIARSAVVGAVEDVRAMRNVGPGRRTLGRPVAIAGVAILLMVTMPVLGDMLNYEPDLKMRAGGTLMPGLTSSGGAMSLPPGLPTIPPGLLAAGGLIAPSTQLGVDPPASVLSAARPWLRSIPNGSGTVATLVVPAPFGGPATTKSIQVYLPPGYATSSTRYPVVYEAPWPMDYWQKGASIQSTLDGLIDGGTIPPVIVVFVSEAGGPYADSECSNSIDGRIWYASWLVQTIVPTIDGTYRTIATPAARAVMGFSQGGFCAAMLVLKYPTVFATGISFSGYFQAGVRSGQTVNAWLPYGANSDYERLYSPIDLASTIPVGVRPFLLLELSANPSGPFYGPQYVGFTRVLKADGIPAYLAPTPLGHAWAAVRLKLPQMLTTWAERMTALSVFE